MGRKPASKTFSWEGITCNDDIWLYNTNAQGLGRDMFWPPNLKRGATVEDLVGVPKGRMIPGACGVENAHNGLTGGPKLKDPWSTWATAYYGGENIAQHRNIVWSNGLLD